MKDDNRIVQGGELNFDNNPEPRPNTPNTPQPTGGFPPVDMKYLDDSLYHFLQNRGGVDYDLPLNTRKSTHVLKVHNIRDPSLEKIVGTLGNSFFKLVKPEYKPAFCLDEPKYFLTAQIELNKNIPLDTLKNAITLLVGQENTDYFIQEFQDSLGVTGEKQIIDISKPEVERYLPGIGQLKKLERRVSVLKDPFLLLLFLEPEERRYITHFFNEAKLSNQPPHILQGVSATSPMPVCDYALSEEEIKRMTTNPQILPFTEILRIGQQYKIRGIKQYTDKLERFNEMLRDIPTAAT